jgi:RNA methyltransferase, TrmH family
MQMSTITSADNPKFKQLKKLAHAGRERRKLRQTLLDGLHLLHACADANLAPALIVLRDGVALDATLFAQIPHMVLSQNLFDAIAPVEHPSGVLALLDLPPAREAARQCCVLLEEIQDPGNLGTLLRTAAAAGVDSAYLSKGCAEAWSPKAMRAGMGAQFGLAIHEHVELPVVARGFPGDIVATSLSGSESLYGAAFAARAAFIFGNEGAGISPELLACATRKVRIPMPGKVESLNVAAAAAVCLFEYVRQQSRLPRPS